MKKISVSLSGHQTSITLESEFFDALQKLSIRQNRSAIINFVIHHSVKKSRNFLLDNIHQHPPATIF